MHLKRGLSRCFLYLFIYFSCKNNLCERLYCAQYMPDTPVFVSYISLCFSANLSRSAFLTPQFYEDLDEVSSSSSLSQPLEPEDSLAVAEEEDEPAPIPVLTPSVPRHPTVVRTPSIQPGFSMQSSPFSRVQNVPIPVFSPGEVQTVPQHMILVLFMVFTTSLACVAAPKINMDSADSTALATKTVKHGAPPTEKITPTTIPAPQAAGRAALSRHMTSQKPGTNILSFTDQL